MPESAVTLADREPLVEPVAAPPRVDLQTPELPTWFVAGLVAAVVWCATVGAFGLALLIVGPYRASTVGVVATAAAGLGAFVAVRRLGPRPRAHHGPAAVAVVLALGFFVFAGAFHSEHLLADRDPAGYINTGRSIARTQEWAPASSLGVFADGSFTTTPVYRPNFFPMFSVELATAWSIGGDTGLLWASPLLGALGLLACFAIGARVVGARWALLVPVFLVLAPLQLWFARDAYSELIVQVVALGGLWLYLEARAARHWGLTLTAGLLVASGELARVDALSIVVGSVVLVALEWVRSDDDRAPARSRRAVLAFFSGLLAGTGLAVAMTHRVASGYINSLRTEYLELFAALAVAVVAVVAVVVVHRVRPGVGRALAADNRLFGAAVAAASALLLWAYVWRPDPIRDLPVAQPGRFVPAATRTAMYEWHDSRSLHWFSAYIGLAGIIVAFIGFVVLAARARRCNRAAALVFLAVVPVTIMYLARPSITPDQPWAMRRYLPVVIPGIVIAIVAAFEAGWRARRALRGRLVRLAATAVLAGAGALVAVPTAAAAAPFTTARMQHGAEAAVHDLCRLAGPDGAYLVYGYRSLDLELPQPLTWFCGVPVAWSGDRRDLSDIATRWQRLGRGLYVATAVPAAIEKYAPHAVLVGHLVISDDGDLEKVFDRAPTRVNPTRVEIWVFRIPPG